MIQVVLCLEVDKYGSIERKDNRIVRTVAGSGKVDKMHYKC